MGRAAPVCVRGRGISCHGVSRRPLARGTHPMSLTSGDTLDLAPMGFSLLIRRTGEETGGEFFEMEMTLAPKSGATPIHVHPKAIETCEVLAGTFDVYIEGAWKPVKTGERIGVPRGVPHSFRNSSPE